MGVKTVKLTFTVLPSRREKMHSICERLNLSEAEYIRGALEARMRRDERKSKGEGV